MQAGQIAGPVKTEFGWHVIQLREVKAGKQVPFEQAREQLATRAGRCRSRTCLQRPHRQARRPGQQESDHAGAGRAPGEPAGAARRARSRAGRAPASPRNPAVQRVAFSESMIEDGTVSDPIEVGTGPQRADPRRRAHARRTSCRWRRSASASSPRSAPIARQRPPAAAADSARRAGRARARRCRTGDGAAAWSPANVPGVPRGAPVPDTVASEADASTCRRRQRARSSAGKVAPGRRPRRGVRRQQGHAGQSGRSDRRAESRACSSSSRRLAGIGRCRSAGQRAAQGA